jgi:hypothetical protein
MRSARFMLVCASWLVLAGCQTLRYDLSDVAVPVSGKPAEAAAETVAFQLEARDVQWVYGAFGESEPDVGALLAERAQGYDEVANFRVRHYSSFVDFLVTHLSLSLVRMKTVAIEGELVRR